MFWVLGGILALLVGVVINGWGLLGLFSGFGILWFCFCFLAAYVKLWDLSLRVWVLVFLSCFGMELGFETGKNGFVGIWMNLWFCFG